MLASFSFVNKRAWYIFLKISIKLKVFLPSSFDRHCRISLQNMEKTIGPNITR